jgi:hypothetical protein
MVASDTTIFVLSRQAGHRRTGSLEINPMKEGIRCERRRLG